MAYVKDGVRIYDKKSSTESYNEARDGKSYIYKETGSPKTKLAYAESKIDTPCIQGYNQDNLIKENVYYGKNKIENLVLPEDGSQKLKEEIANDKFDYIAGALKLRGKDWETAIKALEKVVGTINSMKNVHNFFHAESTEDTLVFVRADGVEMAFRCDKNGIEVEETEDYRDLLKELRAMPNLYKKLFLCLPCQAA